MSTLSPEGVANLAPFSFFGGVTAHPLTVVVSVARRQGQPKDSARNLLATGEAVIHIPHRPLAEAMVETSADVVPEIDEFELVGIATTPACRVKPPRVAEAAIVMECKLVRHLQVGSRARPTDVFFLEVILLDLADEFLDGDLPDPRRLAAVGRLGGDEYCDTHEVFSIRRPQP
jgi:flavin reductase (DIM6/NTAB) family NADH-FMN oxidoreductase RutF